MCNDERFLRLVHASLGYKKLDGFYYKTLARRLKISKQLLSQYLQGDVRMPEPIKQGLIQVLELESYVERLGL